MDTIDTEPAHGGAIVLVDEEMNAVSLRMYNEAESQQEYSVRVEAVDETSNPLCTYIAQLVKSDQNPWCSFSSLVAENVDKYRENLRVRLDMVK